MHLSSAPADRYRERFRAVLEYIDAHLDDSLSVEQLSAIAAFSKFHFHRQFTEWFGLGVFKYVQLTRLKYASFRLAFRDDHSILEIALASGYEGPEAFARAYRKALNQSPAEFRKQPHWDAWYALCTRLNALRSEHMQSQFSIDQVSIIDFPGAHVAVLEHIGDPHALGDSLRRFIQWRRETGTHPSRSRTYNIIYDDPARVAPQEYRFDLCAGIDGDVAPNGFGIVSRTIPAGRCAKLRVVGGDDSMANGIRFLYSQWLPHSGEELRDFPLFLERVRFFPDVPEPQQVLEIYLPLRASCG